MKHDKKKQWLSIGLLTLGAAALAIFLGSPMESTTTTQSTSMASTLAG